MPERVFSEGHVLPDQRKVRVLAYDDGSVRFRLDGTPYVMEECFLQGGSKDHAIVKLTPRATVQPAMTQDAEASLREQMQSLLTQLKAVARPSDDSRPGHIVRRHQRDAMINLLTLLLMQPLRDESDDD